jgi:hypothetical protein
VWVPAPAKQKQVVRKMEGSGTIRRTSAKSISNKSKEARGVAMPLLR